MDIKREEGHDATDELLRFGSESLQAILDAAIDFEPKDGENRPAKASPKSGEAPAPVYEAHFEGLVDLVEGDEGVLFMLRDDDGRIEFVSEATTPAGDLVVPPPKSQLPFVLPRAAGVEEMRVAQEPVPVTVQSQLLFDDIVMCLRETAELPRDEHYMVLAAWVMHTYLLDAFQYTPILCLFAVPERGKTRTGKIMTYLSYRGLHVESLREAYILRVAENLRCTLFIDVTDLWRKAEKAGSEDVILQRFEKGVKVARVNNPERGPFKDIVYYDIFGPTIIGTNEALDRILETRSITISMPESTKQFEQDVTPERVLPLRERLLLFRAQYMGKPMPEGQTREGALGRHP